MINKQRVKRIRGVIYTCIFLVIFVPVILMIIISFRTMGYLGELTAYLARQSSPAISEQSQESQGDFSGRPAQDEGPLVKEQSATAPNGPLTTMEIGDAGLEPEGDAGLEPEDDAGPEPEDAAGSESVDGADPEPEDGTAGSPNEGGRVVANSYLPASYPDLHFDTIPVDVPPQKNTLYLTFDNTPASQTGAILSVLKKHDVRATFFVWWNESMEAENGTFYRQLAEAGHQIGIHSKDNVTTFSDLYSSTDNFLRGFNEIFNKVYSQTGIKPRLYRLPGGSVNPYSPNRQKILYDIKAELDARGFRQFDWTASAEDAVLPSLSKEQVLRNLENSISDSGLVIILLHDGTGSSSTVEALDELISQYKAGGYSFDILEHDTETVSFLDK